MIKHKKSSVIISVIIAVVLLVSSTIAWFYLSADVTVDYGSTLECAAGHSIELSVDSGANWSSYIKLAEEGEVAGMVDITGDGINMYVPANVNEIGEPSGGFKTATPIDTSKTEGVGLNADYLEYEIWFRSIKTIDVFLRGESFVLPAGDGSGEDDNMYGHFSRDYISAAMRLSVSEITQSGDEVLKMIWAPNPEIELVQNSNGTYDLLKPDSSGNGGGTREEYKITKKVGDEYVTETITAEQYANKLFVAGSTEASDVSAGSSPLLVRLTEKDADGFYTAKVKLRVWFEGTDREANQALSGGLVKMNFKFNGMEKQTDTAKQAQIDSVTYSNGVYSGVEEGMLYTQNGYDWSTYTASTVLPTEGEIFFKYAETDEYYETACKKITLSQITQ